MRKLFRNRRLKISLITLLLIGLGVLFLLFQNYQKQIEQHPLADPDVGFQMYSPEALPEGFRITGKRINVRHERFYNWDGDPNKIADVSVDMNLREGNWVYSIREYRAQDYDKKEIVTALRNYTPTSVKPSCTQRTSPKNQQYRLCHWIDYGRISVFEVKFIKNGTYIDTAFPSTKDRVLELTEIDAYVDSFEEADPEGLPMLVDAV